MMTVRLSCLPSGPEHPAGLMSNFNIEYSFTSNEEDSGSSTLPENWEKREKLWGSLLLVALGVSPT